MTPAPLPRARLLAGPGADEGPSPAAASAALRPADLRPEAAAAGAASANAWSAATLAAAAAAAGAGLAPAAPAPEPLGFGTLHISQALAVPGFSKVHMPQGQGARRLEERRPAAEGSSEAPRPAVKQ